MGDKVSKVTHKVGDALGSAVGKVKNAVGGVLQRGGQIANRFAPLVGQFSPVAGNLLSAAGQFANPEYGSQFMSKIEGKAGGFLKDIGARAGQMGMSWLQKKVQDNQYYDQARNLSNQYLNTQKITSSGRDWMSSKMNDFMRAYTSASGYNRKTPG